jgi:hypothetical protein
MGAAPLRGHYQDHNVFTSPENHQAVIWRYIDFTKLVSMLHNRALFFVPADRLGDPFEGSYPSPLLVARSQALAELGEKPLAQIATVHEQLRRWTFINCWNVSGIESAALWGLYVPRTGGVAIRSTFDRLRRAFGPTVPGEAPEIYIGQVHYVDLRRDRHP